MTTNMGKTKKCGNWFLNVGIGNIYQELYKNSNTVLLKRCCSCAKTNA